MSTTTHGSSTRLTGLYTFGRPSYILSAAEHVTRLDERINTFATIRIGTMRSLPHRLC